MKVLQWNVWHREDISNILKTIRGIDPDIVCLQELVADRSPGDPKSDRPRYIAEGLGFGYFFKSAQDEISDGRRQEFGNGIFSRYPILDSHHHCIQDPQEPDGEALDYSKEGRVYVEVVLDVDGKRLTVGTTHMSYTDRFVPNAAKEAEAERLMEILRDRTERFIFTGDLNVPPESDIVTGISGILRHAGPDFFHKTWATKPFSYNGFEVAGLVYRLDYGFVSPDMAVKTATVVDTPYSDHLPLLLEF
ncbi:MAG: hypothetical protein HGB37_04080 [Candidatus Moranbacteria bacterium]|nr:hypothetical protein [Candidatus Moranbacteria bacterium]